MSLFKKALWVVVLTSGGFLCVLSCQRSSTPYKIYYLDSEKRHIDYSRAPKGDLENRPKEEEIKYFFPTGRYRLDINDLDYEELPDISYDKDYDDGYDYIDSYTIEEGWNIVDLKGNILSELDIRNKFEKAEVEGDMYYRTKINPYEYEIIYEWYAPQAVETTYYCKKILQTAVPEDLILDDNFIIRLYDKKGKVIDEHKMRNGAHMGTYKTNPALYQKKIEDGGVSNAHLIGMLKLPPKNKRKGLKYRVLRLDKSGKPKSYLYREAYKYPYQYYLHEEPLPPYSEYKYWKYSKETGCYSQALYP